MGISVAEESVTVDGLTGMEGANEKVFAALVALFEDYMTSEEENPFFVLQAIMENLDIWQKARKWLTYDGQLPNMIEGCDHQEIMDMIDHFYDGGWTAFIVEQFGSVPRS